MIKLISCSNDLLASIALFKQLLEHTQKDSFQALTLQSESTAYYNKPEIQLNLHIFFRLTDFQEGSSL